MRVRVAVSTRVPQQQQLQQDDTEGEHRELGCGQGGGSRGRGSLLLPWSVTQRGGAAGDAHGVEFAGAKLLVTRRRDETSAGGGAGFAVVYSCKKMNRKMNRNVIDELLYKIFTADFFHPSSGTHLSPATKLHVQ